MPAAPSFELAKTLGNPWLFYHQYSWDDLSMAFPFQESAQTHFKTLGFSKSNWDGVLSLALKFGLDWDSLDSTKRNAASTLGFDKKTFNAPSAAILGHFSKMKPDFDLIDWQYRKIVSNDGSIRDVQVLWSDILSYEEKILRGLGWNEDLWNDKSKYPNTRFADC